MRQLGVNLEGATSESGLSLPSDLPLLVSGIAGYAFLTEYRVIRQYKMPGYIVLAYIFLRFFVKFCLQTPKTRHYPLLFVQ
mgnify:CR=1 FL=1